LFPSAYEGYRAAANSPLHFCKDEPDRYFNEHGKEVQDDTVLLTVLESSVLALQARIGVMPHPAQRPLNRPPKGHQSDSDKDEGEPRIDVTQRLF